MSRKRNFSSKNCIHPFNIFHVSNGNLYTCQNYLGVMVSLNALITQLGSRVKPPVTSNKHGDRGKELAEV